MYFRHIHIRLELFRLLGLFELMGLLGLLGLFELMGLLGLFELMGLLALFWNNNNDACLLKGIFY